MDESIPRCYCSRGGSTDCGGCSESILYDSSTYTGLQALAANGRNSTFGLSGCDYSGTAVDGFTCMSGCQPGYYRAVVGGVSAVTTAGSSFQPTPSPIRAKLTVSRPARPELSDSSRVGDSSDDSVDSASDSYDREDHQHHSSGPYLISPLLVAQHQTLSNTTRSPSSTQ